MTIGSVRLLEEHGSPLNVAKALIRGQLNAYDQQFASEAIGSGFVFQAARLQIDAEDAVKPVGLIEKAKQYIEEL